MRDYFDMLGRQNDELLRLQRQIERNRRRQR